MKIQVVYGSRGGNAKRLAEAVAEAVGATAVEAAFFNKEQDTELLFVGTGIYAGKLHGDITALLGELGQTRVKQVAVFSTSLKADVAPGLVRKLLTNTGVEVLPESYHCPGSFLVFNKGRPGEEDLTAAAAFARGVLAAHSSE